jgi:thiol:disulfide interchange protein DsbC
MKQVVAERKDIVFYIKMLPLVQIHPQAYNKSKAIVCEKSNEKSMAMLEDAFAKKPLPEPSCDTDAIDKNIELAASFGIRGTPTIIFQNGKKMSGAPPAADLIKLIESSL